MRSDRTPSASTPRRRPETAPRTTGRLHLRTIVAAVVAAAVALPAAAGQDCSEDAMVVFDGSGSMSEMGFNQLDEPRIFEARRAVRRSIPSIAAHRRLGLIVYGPGPEESACGNIDLRFPPLPNAAGRIISDVDSLSPSGETPLTDAVRRAAETLDYRRRPGAIVVVTDGKETCGGAPCALAAELAADGYDLTVHVIGFKIRGEHFSWDSQELEGYRHAVSVARCLADRTGGDYVSTETAAELADALRDTLGCQLIGRLETPETPRR